MKRFTILRNTDKDKRGTFTKRVYRYLAARGAECFVSDDGNEITEDVDCVIVLGGDGTLLRAAKKVVDRQIPLLGINLGTLGYLAEVDRGGAEKAMDCLLNDRFSIEKRMMLQGTIIHNDEIIASDIALNDVVIVRQGHLRVVNFMNHVNDAYLNSYKADGIILSTATGSTGYSLSAGGPIVSPEAEIILMTAISPHTLNTRSIVFQRDDRITVEIGQGNVSGIAEANVSFDGGAYISVDAGDRVIVERSEKQTNIIKISDISFLEVLRKKMTGN
ncbi:MAG: NAD(+)/NADH kinase [Lachnospiraceae bacterium]|nr:NAD(+)/NADH kinase [Lachnospiraceae bacterium]